MRGAVTRSVGLLTLVAVLASGCETLQANPKTTIGGVGGATFGGVIAGAAGTIL